MTDTGRFRLWVVGGLFGPPVIALALGLLRSSECMESALTAFGTICEILGLAFAAVQLNGAAKHWKFPGFWRRLFPEKPMPRISQMHAAPGAVGLDARATLTDASTPSFEVRLARLEGAMVEVQRNVQRVEKEQDEKREALRRAIDQQLTAAKAEVADLAEQVKAEAVADFGAGFAAIFVTGWGMFLTNYAECLSWLLCCGCVR